MLQFALDQGCQCLPLGQRLTCGREKGSGGTAPNLEQEAFGSYALQQVHPLLHKLLSAQTTVSGDRSVHWTQGGMTEVVIQTTRGVLARWLDSDSRDIGPHTLHLMTELKDKPDGLVDELRVVVRHHYVAPDVLAKRLADLGAPQTAALLQEKLPTSKRARSGDLGEILTTEIAEEHLAYQVPIRRLRWKDGRNVALRGDDIVGIARDSGDRLRFLKGESKSRISLTMSVIREASDALHRDKGRPTRHSVLFVADRLREGGNDDLALELDKAVLNGFRGHRIEHLLCTVTGNKPDALLSEHLESCQKEPKRHAVGVHISNHGKFIEELFQGV